MATQTDSRINDPDGFLAGRIVDPESVAAKSSTEGTGSGNSTGTGSENRDTFARDDDGNVKRNKDGSPQRKRGRKPGAASANGSKSAAKNQASIKGLEKILYSLHAMAATAIAPELALDEQESALLAQAIKNVQDFYEIEASAEVMLWVNTIGICGAIYGPRVVAMYARKKSQRKKEAKINPVEKNQPIIIEGMTVPHHAPAE